MSRGSLSVLTNCTLIPSCNPSLGRAVLAIVYQAQIGIASTWQKDRPVNRLSEEIEVTPEMIEAGASVLCGFNTYFTGEAFWAEKVYRVMAEVALRKGRGGVV